MERKNIETKKSQKFEQSNNIHEMNLEGKLNMNK